MFAGGVHEGEARQEGLQIEPDMALGGGFAAAMFGPVQTAGDQLNGGRVHDMNHPLETEGERRAPVAGRNRGAMFANVPARPRRVARPVADRVCGWRARARSCGGGVAPRNADSGPECSRRASHTSLRPRLWVIWA